MAAASPAVAQQRGALQVAARVVSLAPSRTALALAQWILDRPGAASTRSSLARIVLADPSPADPRRRTRVVRIDFLRN